MIKNCFFIILSLLCGSVNGQKVIPFRLTDHNNIILKTIVNGKDSLDLMFQLAMEDAAISPQRTHSIHNVIFDTTQSGSNTIVIGNMRFDKIFFENNQLSGQESDGKIGTGIFKDKIFKIDYDSNRILIYDSLPPTINYNSISMTYKNQVMNIEIDSYIGDKFLRHSFYLQSGYAGGLLFDNKFADSCNLNKNLFIKNEKKFKDANGKVIVSKQAIIQKIKISNIEIKDVTAGFLKGQSIQYSLFGADLLKRFNWIFDRERKTAYIIPNKHFHDPFFQLK